MLHESWSCVPVVKYKYIYISDVPHPVNCPTFLLTDSDSENVEVNIAPDHTD